MSNTTLIPNKPNNNDMVKDDNGRMISKTKHHVNPMRLDSDDKHRILSDYHAFCKRDTFNYMNFANKDVNYKNFDMNQISNRLQRHNSMYTIAMLSNVLAPFEREDITISTLLEVYSSYKLMIGLNPDFKMDCSRLFESAKEHADNMLENPKWELFKPVISSLSEKFGELSTHHLETTVMERQRDGDLDETIMTPRQVACLKVNFMEQCYNDMRRDGLHSSDDHCKRCIDNYNKALAHLTEISKNSGFDMSAVAVEERYIVAAKMQDDPSYGRMFEETAGLYGAKPVFYGPIGQKSFYGHLMTPDEHFESRPLTVRSPIRNIYDKPVGDTLDPTAEGITEDFNNKSFVSRLARYGDQLGYAMRYVDSDVCRLPQGQKDIVRDAIEAKAKSFGKELKAICQDDGISKDVISSFKSHFKKASECDETDINYKKYLVECHYVMCRDSVDVSRNAIYNRLHDLFVNPENCGKSDFECGDVEAKLREHLGEKGNICSSRDLYINICQDAFSYMSVNDISTKLLHVADNMEQRFIANSDYSRESTYESTVPQDDISEVTVRKNKPVVKKSDSVDREIPLVDANNSECEVIHETEY